jgi:hypothetical protein
MAAPGAAGELLLSVAPPDPFLVASGPPWSGPGQPAPFALPIPPDSGLIGASFFAQGLLVDPTAALGVTFGLTEGVELVLGH